MQWGREPDGRWIPLIPLGEDDGFERSFQDEDGNLRAQHRLVCTGRGAIQVTRLPRPIAAANVMSGWTEPDADGVIEPKFTIKQRRKRKKKNIPHESDGDIPFTP